MTQPFTSYDALLLWHAFLTTLYLSLCGGALAVMGGTGLGLVCFSRMRLFAPLRLFLGAACTVIRRIPFIIVLYLVFYVSGMSGLDISAVTVSILAIGLIGSTYITEIVHGGLRAVGPEKIEVARTMNMGGMAIIRHVILPQSLPLILPPMLGYLVLFIKDTALASQIGVIELNQAGIILTNRGLPTFRVFFTILILYFVISFPLTVMIQKMEKKLVVS